MIRGQEKINCWKARPAHGSGCGAVGWRGEMIMTQNRIKQSKKWPPWPGRGPESSSHAVWGLRGKARTDPGLMETTRLASVRPTLDPLFPRSHADIILGSLGPSSVRDTLLSWPDMPEFQLLYPTFPSHLEDSLGAHVPQNLRTGIANSCRLWSWHWLWPQPVLPLPIATTHSTTRASSCHSPPRAAVAMVMAVGFIVTLLEAVTPYTVIKALAANLEWCNLSNKVSKVSLDAISTTPLKNLA